MDNLYKLFEQQVEILKTLRTSSKINLASLKTNLSKEIKEIDDVAAQHNKEEVDECKANTESIKAFQKDHQTYVLHH